METQEILNTIIETEKISFEDSFYLCRECAKLLRNKETNTEGRKILIYILDNWMKIDDLTKEMWIELIESEGFYPYLSKENFELNFTTSKIRKNMSKSRYLDYYFHDEQIYVKNLIDSGRNVIVSAPTSFGKSLLIEEIVAEGKYKNIVIIQPTLALLDETRKKLKKYNNHYKIIVRTTQKPSEEKGNLFLLTAERVMEYKNLPKIDFLIIDEFYKLSAKRDDERSDVLNNAFYLLLKRDNVRFYLLGPNIDGISNGFAEKYNAVFFKTDYSLVEQSIIDMSSNNFGSRGQKKINKENALFELLFQLKDEQTMIYCSSPSKARKLSKKFYDFIKDKIKPNTEDDIPLIEWIKKNITKNWSLVEQLKYKIAFHDGALQKHISSSIVKYFNDKKINFLFCTSTIIEGVNTSAKNIIIFDNKKGARPIDYFDYSNIKGRAGRMMIHYIGKVYNFNPPIKKEEMIIDIPFFQQNPIKDEVLIHLENNDVKNKDSEQYKKLQNIPREERELFKKNGMLIYGQKEILDILRRDIEIKKDLITWSRFPKYEQLEYILNLGWDYLLKNTETTRPMTISKLVKVTFDYGTNQDVRYLVKSNYDFMINGKGYEKLSKQEILDEAVRDAFNILRHWFQYKVPKWLRVINSLQEFVCNELNIKSGNYSFYADKIESDFVQENLSILLEYGIPKSAIKKIEKHIDKLIPEDDVIKLLKNNNLLNKIDLLTYEIEKIYENL